MPTPDPISTSRCSISALTNQLTICCNAKLTVSSLKIYLSHTSKLFLSEIRALSLPYLYILSISLTNSHTTLDTTDQQIVQISLLPNIDFLISVLQIVQSLPRSGHKHQGLMNLQNLILMNSFVSFLRLEQRTNQTRIVTCVGIKTVNSDFGRQNLDVLQDWSTRFWS